MTPEILKDCITQSGGSKDIWMSLRRDIHYYINMRSVFISITISLLVVNFIFSSRSSGRLSCRPSAPPEPFFSYLSHDVLIDYYDGNNAHPSKLLGKSDVVIVMYYAPWSRRCKQMRMVFEKVARGFTGCTDITFAAVNCFTSSGDCRRAYKTQTFPLIVAYIGRMNVIYNDVLALDYIYRWVLRIRKPVHRIISNHDLEEFMLSNDKVVIGVFTSEVAFAVSKPFLQYYKATLLLLENRDIIEIRFALITNPALAASLNFSLENNIYLILWDRVVRFWDDDDIATEDLADWIKNECAADSKDGLRWITPVDSIATKSVELVSALHDGPTVMLLTEREVLYPNKQAISVVEQTAMEYFACDAKLSDRLELLAMKRNELSAVRPHLITADKLSCRGMGHLNEKVRSCCVSALSFMKTFCFMCFLNNETFINSVYCRKWTLALYKNHDANLYTPPCLTVMSHFSPEFLSHECCGMLSGKSESSRNLDSGESCGQYSVAKELYRCTKGAITEDRPFDDASVKGLSCSRNDSLRFIAIDSMHNSYILAKLGSPFNCRTAILIVDFTKERTYLMRAAFSRQAFRNFLRSYHNRSLQSHVVSERSWRHSSYVIKAVQDEPPSLFTIPKITANTVWNTLNSSKDTVVFLTGGGWHGPSMSVIYLFHTVAYYFRQYKSLMAFYIIDVSRNGLDWQFKMDSLPAVLFFPALRTSARSRFPPTIPITLPNLLAFIMSRCHFELRWHIALSSCSNACVRKNITRLQRLSLVLKNDITSLRHFLSNISSQKSRQIIMDMITRRQLQLLTTRRLLAVTSTLRVLI